MMIALLDNDLDDLEAMVTFIKENGIPDVRSFHKEEEFENGIKADTIVIIIDHSLGSGRTGLNVMKRVLDAHPICYPIIVSGNEDGKVIREYMNNDAWRYIVKGEKNWLKDLLRYVKQAEENVRRVANHVKKLKSL